MEQTKELVYLCADRVKFQGRYLNSKIVKHYLLHGVWVSKVPKKPRYRAQVRLGATMRHLGCFDTVEERDAAVAAFKADQATQAFMKSIGL